MGKNKNKALGLSRADNTILTVIAALNCPLRQFSSEAEAQAAKIHIANLKEILTGKPRRVASCILDKNLQENNKVRRKADILIDMANSMYEVAHVQTET